MRGWIEICTINLLSNYENSNKSYDHKKFKKVYRLRFACLGSTTWHYYETGKQNKGWKGLVLERLAGLQTNVSKAPNGLSYELKSVAFRYVKNELVPKETMAITMINPAELKAHSFFESHCWAKLKTIVFCAVEWKGKNAESGKLLKVASLDFAEDDELIQEIKADYDFIREKLIKHGFESLTGKDGKWIQARTKGVGGINPRTGERRPITRAFYARTGLVKKIFETAS